MGEMTPQDLSALIEEHLPLVKHIVFQVAVHFPRHVEREELARAGALGLVEAARRYDDSRGVPFERFAAQRIRGAILDAVRAADWAPRSVRMLARKLENVEQRLATQLGRVPSLDEMAEALDMTRQEIARLQDRMFRSVVLALEHEVGDMADEELTLVDVLIDERRSSRSKSSRTASCTGISAMRSRCCPNAIASWSSATSSRTRRRRSWPASSASPNPACRSCAPKRS